MLHPSYSDLMKVVNQDVEEGATKIVTSRYSIVLATSKRARQIIGGDTPLLDGVDEDSDVKPLSAAVEELATNRIQILPEDEE